MGKGNTAGCLSLAILGQMVPITIKGRLIAPTCVETGTGKVQTVTVLLSALALTSCHAGGTAKSA